MSAPIQSPDGHWWNHPVAGTEKAWLGASVVTAVILFGWMVGWSHLSEQTPTGRTYRVSAEGYRPKGVRLYGDGHRDGSRASSCGHGRVRRGLSVGEEGFPVVLEAGIHLGSYDVQHGFPVRDQDDPIQQFSLQILPGYEWIVPMTFEDPGTYRVICNEFCGLGHRLMQNKFVVVEGDPS